MQRYNDKQWRYDSMLLLFCISGRIVLTVQGKKYEVTKDQLFMCQNVRVLETAMTSTDFECIAWGLNLNYVNEVVGSKVDWMKFLLHLLLALGNDDCRHRTVSYFADKLNIFARYFTAVCKQESGKTPSELIHERTIDRIRQLLQESDLSIK